jgi:WD40 repeat protein
LDPAAGGRWGTLAFDPNGRYLLGVRMGGAWLIPLDGSAARRLEGPSSSTQFNTAAVSPSGRRVAAVTSYGSDIVPLRVWDVGSGAARTFSFDDGPTTRESQGRTGLEGGISHVAFADDDTVYTAGVGGLRRWDVERGTQEILVRASSGYQMFASFGAGARVALTAERRVEGTGPECREAALHDLTNGRSQPLTVFGSCSQWRGVAQLDPSGTVAVSGTGDGIVRVGRLDGGEPHLLLGHRGLVDRMAISPDLRWVATTGQDNTLRLWPMPDLSRPPLHTLPRAELLEKLRSLTNLRVELDPSAPDGWRLDLGPFPGWKTVPEW